MQGILFKPDLTLANIEGRKSRTSRTRNLQKINEYPDEWQLVAVFQDGKARFYNKTTKEDITLKCPYGGYANELYCKETYKVVDADLRDLDKDFQRTKVEYSDGNTKWLLRPKDKYIVIPDKNHSAMMMPAWASRYHIILEKIDCQRIQSITDSDCIKEGILQYGNNFALYPIYHNNPQTTTSPRESFKSLLDTVNPDNWNRNLYNWVLHYRIILK